MKKLRIPGVSAPQTHSSELANSGRRSRVKVTQKAAVQIDQARGAGDAGVVLELEDDDVLELELEGGLRLWTSFRQFQLDFPGVKPAAPQSRDGTRDAAPSPSPGATAATEPEPFPVDLAAGGASRGLGTVMLRAVRVLDVDLPEQTALGVAALLEKQLRPGPGLFRCAADGTFALTPVSLKELATDQPLLIFIHGTASSSHGSFGELWEPAQRAVKDALFKFYGEHVYALEHRTLTESPVQNALQLLDNLPKNARLHLVSHSRGGLVGELLCLGQRVCSRDFDPLAPEILKRYFPDAPSDAGADAAGTNATSTGTPGADTRGRRADRAALTKLAEQLQEKQPTVERFMRVACPARGTTLASGRLDHWLSTIVNVLALAGLKGNPAYTLAMDFVLAVAKERTDPRTLPGLEAQMPESPLVGLLNHPAFTVTADLTVISGDAEAAGIWGRMKLLLPDLFYGEDHDLVVNTSAMYGGAARSITPRFFFDQGPDVNHFHYFKNPNTARRLVAGLTRPDGFEAEFSELPDALRNAPRDAVQAGTQRSRGTSGPRPVVFVLPGFMGSHLAKNGDRIWLDPLELALGRLTELDITATGIRPDGMLGNYYGELVKFLLESGHEVVAFPFDWRKSLLEEARRLAESITSKLEQTETAGLPVRVLAHGMGGLVARALIAECPEVWRRLTARTGARLVLLGTPTAGSYVIPRLLLGRERSLRMLAALDRQHSVKELVAVLGRFPGLLEMLPEKSDAPDAEPVDFFALDFWQKAGAELGSGDEKSLGEKGAALANARQTRGQLAQLDANPLASQLIVYVAGLAAQTPCGVLKSEDATAATATATARVEFLTTPRGDGFAPWDTSIPAGMPRFLVDAAHGDLPAHTESFPAYLELLQTGTTNRLPGLPSTAARSGAPAGRGTLLDQPVGAFPTADEFVAAVLGAAPPVTRVKPQPTLAVTVAHGDLTFTPNVVAVGHYRDDAIVSAEKYLDEKLDGRLRERDRLGLYPGKLETTAVFLKPGGHPGGALVLGLGDVGKLAAGDLSRAFAHGLLRLAVAVLEPTDAAADARPEGTRRLQLSTLLIGTGEGGLSVAEAVKAILEGVLHARAALHRAELDHKLMLAGLEFIELHEDQAIQAAQALVRLRDDPRLRREFAIDPEVKTRAGGRRRARVEEPAGWWDRLEITGAPDGTLRFVTPTNRARANVELVPTQSALVDQFIKRSITNTGRDTATARTLFELLLPNDLKDFATRRRNLLLLVNDAAARYPWELLENRADPGGRPPAVEAGLVRQLATETFRPSVVNATDRSALVVGNPQTQNEFPDLPGAEAEAQRVVDVLELGNFKVCKQLREHAAPIISALFDRPYRILHLAGHGVYEMAVPLTPVIASSFTVPPTATFSADGGPGTGATTKHKITGMVLGHGVFLTPAEVAQMREVPELVFINCCHLGRIENADQKKYDNKNRLAANLATEFIRIGVRAVVAAGWAVDDQAAGTFAVRFYEEMLRGTPFGEAVRAARQAAYEQHPGVNTWGAYQCYGDPEFRFQLGGREGKSAPQRTYTHPREVVMEAENIAGDAYRATTAEDVKKQEGRLTQLIKETPETWRYYGEVCAAVGKAWGELGEFPEAIAQYERALAAEDGAASLQAAEQLSNLEARQAVVTFRAGAKGARADADRLIRQAAARLTRLLALGKTTERLNLLGSLEKRRALISPGPDVPHALLAMQKNYELALAQTPPAKRPENFYSSGNALLAQVLHEIIASQPTQDLQKKTEQWRLALEARHTGTPPGELDFWAAASLADGLLLQHLATGDLASGQAEVIQRYQNARAGGATMRQTKTVQEHLDFIADILATTAAKKDLANTIKVLRAIRTAVTA